MKATFFLISFSFRLSGNSEGNWLFPEFLFLWTCKYSSCFTFHFSSRRPRTHLHSLHVNAMGEISARCPVGWSFTWYWESRTCCLEEAVLRGQLCYAWHKLYFRDAREGTPLPKDRFLRIVYIFFLCIPSRAVMTHTAVTYYTLGRSHDAATYTDTYEPAWLVASSDKTDTAKASPPVYSASRVSR